MVSVPDNSRPIARFENGGEGWIRTSVRLRGQIYSLLPLTTRPPLHEVKARHVAGRSLCVNAGERAPQTKVPGAPSLRFGRFNFEAAPGSSQIGAGEGNRTLVVSLEGFCSTIELHPPARKRWCQMAA